MLKRAEKAFKKRQAKAKGGDVAPLEKFTKLAIFYSKNYLAW